VSGNGTVFRLNTDGTGFVALYNFSEESGENPVSRLTVSSRILYGTAAFLYYAGPLTYGSVFSLSVPPQLTISSSGPNVLMSWPTNFAEFTLQSTTNLLSPVWITNSPAPVVVNGQYTVTNPISGTQQFFRLSQ